MKPHAKRTIRRSIVWLISIGVLGFSLIQTLLPPPADESAVIRVLLYLIEYICVISGPLATVVTQSTNAGALSWIVWAVVALLCIACWLRAFSEKSSEVWAPIAAGCWVVAGTIATALGLAAGV